MCRVRRSRGTRLLAMVLLCALALPLVACEAQPKAPADVRHVTLGVSRESLNALAYIARNEGLFEVAGLDVELVEYDSAQLALQAMLTDEVDACLCADTPIVIAAIEGEPFRIIATVATDANDIKIVARKSAGISAPGDLRGKRVGTRRGTAAHFFLHVYITRYGMADEDVVMSYDSFENVTAALIAGELDAASLRQPFIAQLKNALGDDFVLLEAEGLYGKTMNLCVPTDDAGIDSDTQQRLVRAFILAEEAGVADTSGRILERFADDIGVQPDDVCLCVVTRGAVTLQQSLVLNLEDQVRWAMESGLATAPAAPDMLEHIDTSALEGVDSGRVTLIR